MWSMKTLALKSLLYSSLGTFELVLGGLNWWLVQCWTVLYSANSILDSDVFNVRHCMESILCSTVPARGVLCSCAVSAFSFV
ncbi:hypothetical protein DFJ43DRAFT_1059490 [Lentinula guzmanii]|uniref:Uncharacterized protein n=1 Tax=Lentinula guzmanii TaxID=2804957 RepID=A0AA38JRR0_9AGAR|nr:hypothetical protein DFJ43DRAFT_1059490 [Lentinula guzmanii]